MKITGSAGDGGSISNFVSALNEAGNYLSSQDDGFGQGGIFDYGQEPLDFSPLDPNKIKTDNIRDKGNSNKGNNYKPEEERYYEITKEIYANAAIALHDGKSDINDDFYAGAHKSYVSELSKGRDELLTAAQKLDRTRDKSYDQLFGIPLPTNADNP